MTPTYTPFQYSVQVTIDGAIIDYLLTVDETGHVYEAKPMVFELPEATQKLIIGKSDGQLERKMLAFTSLIRYLIPLSLAGQLDTYQLQFEPLLKEIRDRLQEKGLKWTDLKSTDVPHPIPSEVLAVFAANNQASQQPEEIWNKIICIIENQNKRKTTEAINHIGYHYYDAAAPFFLAIIPFLDYNNQRIAFEKLVHTRTDTMKAYLIKELEQPYSHFYASGILKALKYPNSSPKSVFPL